MLLTANSNAFPPAPPGSIDDPQVIAAHDWAAFDTVRQMKNHWDRPGWTETTRAYYWMLSFQNVPELLKQARFSQQELQHLQFDAIDEHGLHLTLGRIGRAEEVTSRQLDELCAVASNGLPPAFDLSAIPMTASRGAIRYSVAPWTPLIALHASLAAMGERYGLPFRKPTSVLRPHVGIAYCNRIVDANAVRDAIRPLRDLPSVTVPIEHVELVELRREERAYRWRTLHVLPMC